MTQAREGDDRDLLGNELTPEEARLLAAYRELSALLEVDLPPTAQASVREAVASLWLAVHALALTEERPAV